MQNWMRPTVFTMSRRLLQTHFGHVLFRRGHTSIRRLIECDNSYCNGHRRRVDQPKYVERKIIVAIQCDISLDYDLLYYWRYFLAYIAYLAVLSAWYLE